MKSKFIINRSVLKSEFGGDLFKDVSWFNGTFSNHREVARIRSYGWISAAGTTKK